MNIHKPIKVFYAEKAFSNVAEKYPRSVHCVESGRAGIEVGH